MSQTHNQNEECIICGQHLEYLQHDELMQCSLCGREEYSKTRCVNGHYVCNECHINGIDAIINICMNEDSSDPIHILDKIMSQDFCHMHGPEHHIIAGAALLTAYRNSGGKIDLEAGLHEMIKRGSEVPGGICGFWGACGAGISAGIFVAIISDSNPLAIEPFRLANSMTSKSLDAIGRVGGPRCCKRDSFLSLLDAVEFVRENFGVKMQTHEFTCSYSHKNNQCIGTRCPFYASGVNK